jgi:hypothetical protein
MLAKMNVGKFIDMGIPNKNTIAIKTISIPCPF